LEFPESPAPLTDNNERLGYLPRADWPAGNEDCLLDEDGEPQVDKLNPETDSEEERIGYHLSTDICPRGAQWQKGYPYIY